MEERLKKYIKYIESRVNELSTVSEKNSQRGKNTVGSSIEKEKTDLLTQIGFFQHERLVHLIVTVLFAIMTIMAFVVVMIDVSLGALALLFLFTCLLIPYIRHYYILENGIQKLYKLFDRLEKIEESEIKVVAFTFDDGPLEYSLESSAMSILHTLKEYDQHATFFYVGDKINEENQKEIGYAKSIGCEIGNHGFSHRVLTELSKEEIEEEMKATEELLTRITGEPICSTRLPYLACNETVLKTIETPIISCSVDSRDWDEASTEKIIDAVLTAESNGQLDGAIVLMHETYYTTASAVQYLVPTLIKKGYRIVSVSELAVIKNVTLKPHHVYTRL